MVVSTVSPLPLSWHLNSCTIFRTILTIMIRLKSLSLAPTRQIGRYWKSGAKLLCKKKFLAKSKFWSDFLKKQQICIKFVADDVTELSGQKIWICRKKSFSSCWEIYLTWHNNSWILVSAILDVKNEASFSRWSLICRFSNNSKQSKGALP